MMDYFYMIAPVSADPDFAEKRVIVSELAAEAGLKPLFPLDRKPSIALEKASQDIRRARFVLADLTYERPSCYFELGVAEGAEKDVAIIAKAGTHIHQVGYASAVAYYGDLNDYRELTRQILEARTALPRGAAASGRM